LASFTSTVAHQHTVFEEGLHYLLHEEGRALSAFDDQALEWNQILAVAQQRREHFLGAFLAQRVEPQLRVVGLAIPLMRILGPVVDEQQEFRGTKRIREQVQQLLGLLVDPMQVLEDHHQRLIETFA
jgi:hypothetical protein